MHEVSSVRLYPRQHPDSFLHAPCPFHSSWYAFGLDDLLVREPTCSPIDSRDVEEGHRAVFSAGQRGSRWATPLHGGRA